MVNVTLKLTNAQNAAATDFYNDVSHIAIGDDNTTPLEGDTALGNETFRDSLYSSDLTDNVTTHDIRLDVTENNGNTHREIGTFDAPSGGNIYDHTLVTEFAKTSSKEVFYRLKTTYTARNT